jgi:Polyketide cyclase / dehydrase and lipid transport
MRERSTTVEREMAATPAEIWAYRLDFRNLPGYNPNVKHLEQVTEGGANGTGAVYHFDLEGPMGAFPIELEVTRTEPERIVAIEMRGALPAAEVFTVEALDSDAGTDAATDTGSAGQGNGNGARSSVAIALTLRIPDEFPRDGDDDLLAGGVRQVGAELDAMAASLAARTSR